MSPLFLYLPNIRWLNMMLLAGRHYQKHLSRAPLPPRFVIITTRFLVLKKGGFEVPLLRIH
jgi:hypothetical protein